MKLNYFEDTDTLYIEFRAEQVAETRELDEDTLVDLDKEGHLLGLTLEHASARTDISQLDISGIAA